MSFLHPNSNNTALGAAITGASRVTPRYTLPAAKEGNRAGRDAMQYAIGISET
jgi:hypothetical protein